MDLGRVLAVAALRISVAHDISCHVSVSLLVGFLHVSRVRVHGAVLECTF
jgi:hypothetical protein